MLVIACSFGVLAHSATLPFLSAAGVLYGIGHGAIYTVLMALLADLVRPADRGLAFGVFGTAIDLGISSGNFVVGGLMSAIGYSGAFALAAVVVMAAIPVLLAHRPSPAGAPAVEPASP
jgi:MFS family permease